MSENKPIKYLGDFIDGRFIVPDRADGEFKNTSPSDLKDEIMVVEYRYDHVAQACAAAKKAFLERVRINRNFIKTLPGFLGDEMLGHTAANGDFVCITTARWKNAGALQSARSAVQDAYAKEGFHAADFMQKLGIKMERDVLEPLDDVSE